MTTLQLVPASGDAALEISAGQKTMVGRDASVDVVINDASVSRRHAIIERRGDAWMVIDQGSANGTWIDDTRVTEAPLEHGQTLRLGAVSFFVALPEGYSSVAPLPRVAPKAAPPVATGGTTRIVPPTRMTVEEAAALLGLWEGAPPEEVRRQYQRICNDLQIRLTNAPAASLRRMYQKNLQDLKAAAELLCPGLLQ